MSVRVGIDLVSVDAVRDSLADHGDQYLRRVYSAREVNDCRRGGISPADVDPRRLAARFAAKEAAFKAIRVGDEPVSWTDVEVVSDPVGSVRLALMGNAARLGDSQGLVGFAVSLTHQRDFAAAVVIAEIQRTADIA